jgi:hypothetical protein
MTRPFQFSSPLYAITDTERLKFQLSLLNLVFQGELPPETVAELQRYAGCRALPILS